MCLPGATLMIRPDEIVGWVRSAATTHRLACDDGGLSLRSEPPYD
jgi:hypothetical protein